MDKYLKMADVFDCDVGSDTPFVIGDSIYNAADLKHCIYAAHAITSHDELVENVLHYEADALMWERRAVTEASRAQELVAEVERLRGMVIRMQTYLDMAGEYPEKESDNPVRNWMFDALDCIK